MSASSESREWIYTVNPRHFAVGALMVFNMLLYLYLALTVAMFR